MPVSTDSVISHPPTLLYMLPSYICNPCDIPASVQKPHDKSGGTVGPRTPSSGKWVLKITTYLYLRCSLLVTHIIFTKLVVSDCSIRVFDYRTVKYSNRAVIYHKFCNNVSYP